MSTWTYVNGYVKFYKVDSNVLGKIVRFDDLANNCKEECVTIIPMGSEGGIEYEIVGDYAIFDGALRDFSYDNIDEIKKYFTNISKSNDCDSINIMVRVSTGERIILYKEWFDDKLKEIKVVEECGDNVI